MVGLMRIVYGTIVDYLNGIEVDGVAIPVFVDVYGDAPEGIHIASYREEDDSPKGARFSTVVYISLEAFARNRDITFVAEITDNIKERLKASANTHLILKGGTRAIYNLMPSITSTTEAEGREKLHRNTIEVVLRIDSINS